jgi:NADH-quinone oxidoreductase subunit F
VIARFYDHESCGQCSQCREGTQWLSQIFERIESGHGKPEDIDLLVDLSNGMTPGKTICALSDAAAIPTLAVVKHFREELEAHIELGGCPHKNIAPAPRFAEGASA